MVAARPDRHRDLAPDGGDSLHSGDLAEDRTALAHPRRAAARKHHVGGGVDRDVDGQAEARAGGKCPALDAIGLALGVPIGVDGPVDRLVRAFGVVDPTPRRRLDTDLLVPRRRGRDAADVAVHPVAHGAVGVVVEGVHVDVAEAAVGHDRVPALPHRGRALLDLIAPRRILSAHQQLPGDIVAPDRAERRQQPRSTEEPGGQVVPARGDLRDEQLRDLPSSSPPEPVPCPAPWRTRSGSGGCPTRIAVRRREPSGELVHGSAWPAGHRPGIGGVADRSRHLRHHPCVAREVGRAQQRPCPSGPRGSASRRSRARTSCRWSHVARIRLRRPCSEAARGTSSWLGRTRGSPTHRRSSATSE